MVARDAVLATIVPGMSMPTVDIGSAIAWASAHGIQGGLAADLIAAAAEGVVLGYTDKRDRDRANETAARDAGGMLDGETGE